MEAGGENAPPLPLEKSDSVILFGQLQKRGIKFPIFVPRQFFLTPTELRYSHTFKKGFSAIALKQIKSIEFIPPDGILIYYFDSGHKSSTAAPIFMEMALKAHSQTQAKRWIKALRDAIDTKISSRPPVPHAPATAPLHADTSPDACLAKTAAPAKPRTQPLHVDGLVHECRLLTDMLDRNNDRTSAKGPPQNILGRKGVLPIAVELHPLRHYTLECLMASSNNVSCFLGVKHDGHGQVVQLLKAAPFPYSYWVFDKLTASTYSICLATRRHTRGQ